ncbi:interleukin-17C, partial [Pristimantis euphronides]
WAVLLLAVCFINICNAKNVWAKNHRHGNHHPDSSHCFSKEELENSPSKVVSHFVGSKMHWNRYSAVELVTKLEETERRRKRRKRAPEVTCPQFTTLQRGEGMNERSISPWNYRIDTDENRYPQKLAFAQCLCNHCIGYKSGKEEANLNSVLVQQTMLVLRKKTCPHNSTLSTFMLEYIKVPVACTCSVPLY